MRAVTEMLAGSVVGWDPGAEAGPLRERARDALVDVVGVAVAGVDDDGWRRAVAASAGECPAGRSIVLPSGEATSPGMAAFLNGCAAHALDFDDVSDTIYGHPSAVLFPAMLAVADDRRLELDRVLDSYVVGYEVACVVARLIPVRPHYSAGWHASSTVGVIGAAAGLAHLLELDQARTRHLIALASTTASGSRQNFGSMTKPFHVGHAARDAVVAAQLVEHGFTADGSALEGPLGYFALMGAGGEPDTTSTLGRVHDLLEVGLNVKQYPCCYNTHRTADAVRRLHGVVDPADVERIVVSVEPRGLDPLVHHRPTDGIQGKFSLEYVAAAALVEGQVDLLTFTDEHVLRPQLQDLLTLVEGREVAEPPRGSAEWDYAFSVVEIHLRDGSVVWERTDTPLGHRNNPIDRAALDAKFLACFDFAGRTDGPEHLSRLRAGT